MNNDIGLFDTITAEYIVAGAKMELDLTSTTTQDVYLLNKVNEGLGMIRSFTLIPAIAELEIDPVTFSAKCPSWFTRLQGSNPIRLIDPLDTQIDVQRTGLAPTNNVDGFFKGGLNTSFSAEVVDGYIYFGSAVTATKCEISYISTNIDANGNIKIPSLAYTPLVSFLCSEWLRKNNDSRFQIFATRWKEGKRWIKGIFAQADSLEIIKLGNTNNHLPLYR